MKTEQLYEEMNEVFRDELEDDSIEVKPETVAKDIDGWDSLAHIQIIVALEKHFKIRFTSSEISQFKNVGELADIINKKMS